MAAVRLKERNETTLKHFYKKDGKVILHPANPTMEDIVIENPAQVEVQGKVVLVIRQL
jgi:repressor LexA